LYCSEDLLQRIEMIGDPRPLLGVSLDFLHQLCEDNRLGRPIHKLGRPTAALASMKAPSLRALSRTLRVHSDLPAPEEFAMYNNETLSRDALVKALKRVPSTSTHIVTCIVRPEIKRLKQRLAREATEAAAKAAEEAAAQKAKEDEQTQKNGGVPLKKRRVPPPPAPPPPLLPHVNDNSYASLVLAGNDVGPATDFVSYSRQSSFRDLVDALETEDQETVSNRTKKDLLDSMRRFYYIDIFCECCDAPPSYDDDGSAFFDTLLPEIIGRIGRTILIPGRSMFEQIPERKKQGVAANALAHSRVLWDCTVSTMHLGSDFSVALTRRDQTALEVHLAQAADIEFMLSLIGAGRPVRVGLPQTRPSGNDKTAAAVEADVDEMALFLTLQDLLDKVLEIPVPSSSAVMHNNRCDLLQQSQSLHGTLKQVMGRQFDGGFSFVDRMVKKRLTEWFSNVIWSIAVKWRLVGNIFIYDTGAVYSAPILTGRSSRPSTAHSRKSRPGSSSRKPRSRVGSRAGLRPGTANSSQISGGRRQSSVLKKRQNQKSTPAADGAGNADVDADDIEAMMEEDEDPIFELLLVIASFYLHKHRTHHAERLRLRIPLETDTSVSLLLDTEENDFNGANESNNSNISGSSISLLPSTDLLRAEALLRVVLEQREANFGAVHEKTFEALTVLAEVLHHQGRLPAAERLFRRVLNWFPPAVHRRPVETWDVAKQEVVVSMTESEVVVSMAESEVEVVKQTSGLADGCNIEDLSLTDVSMTESEVVVSMAESEVEVVKQTSGLADGCNIEDLSLTDASTVRTMRLFGLLLKDKGLYSESELIFTRVQKAVEQSLGPAAVESLEASDDIATVHRAAGRADEAAQIMRRTLNKREVALPEDDERTIESCFQLGMLFAKEGAELDGGLEAAHTLLARVLEVRRPNPPEAVAKNSPETAGLGGSGDEAAPESPPTDTKTISATAWSLQALDAEYTLAWVLARRRRLRRSEDMARHVLSMRDQVLGPMHMDSMRAADRLGAILLLRLEQKGDGESEPKFWPEDAGYETELEKEVRLCILIQLWWRRTWRNIKRQRAIKAKEESDPVFKMMRAEHAAHLLKLEEEAEKRDGEEIEPEPEPEGKKEKEKEPETLDVNASLSKMQEDLEGEKVASAEREIEMIFRRCASGFEELLGSMHPHTLKATRQLGNFLVRTSSLEEGHHDQEAEVILRATLLRRQDALGNKHRDTLTSCADLASLLFKRIASSNSLDGVASADNNVDAGGEDKKKNRVLLLEECERLFRRTLSMRDETLGKLDPLTLLSVNHLAAFLHYKRARRQPLLFTGKQATDKGQSYAAPFGGKSYAKDRTTRELVALFQRDLDGCLHHQNDPLATAKALSNLGQVHWETGNLTSAVDLYEQCLSLKQAHLGDNDPSTLRTMLALGKLLQATGNMDAAVDHTRSAYNEMEAVCLRWYHDDVLDAALNLATLLIKRGFEPDESEAEALLRRTVDGRKRTRGISRAPKTIDAMSMLARLLMRRLRRKTGEARCLLDKSSPSQRDTQIETEKLLRLVVAERCTMYGDNDARTLSSRRRLAEALYERYLRGGDNANAANAVLVEAEREARACAEGHARRRRINAVDGTVPLLRQILQSMGRGEEADGVEAVYLERVLGVEHLRTLNAMRSLALKEWQFDQARCGAGAVALLQKCAAGYTTLRATPTNPYNKHRGGGSGDSDPHCTAAVSAMEELASAIERHAAMSGKRDLLVECERVRRDIVRTLVQSHGSTDEKTLQAVDKLGSLVWKEFGRLSEARIMLQRVVDGRMIRLGQRHSATNQALRKLSSLVLEAGEVETAEALARQALEGFLLRREERGFEFEGRDVDVAKCANVLAEILRRGNQPGQEVEAAAILARYS
jgi:tetratricopeptide (TPR) repeat protein